VEVEDLAEAQVAAEQVAVGAEEAEEADFVGSIRPSLMVQYFM
jgi:hypothetical protein